MFSLFLGNGLEMTVFQGVKTSLFYSIDHIFCGDHIGVVVCIVFQHKFQIRLIQFAKADRVLWSDDVNKTIIYECIRKEMIQLETCDVILQ